MPPQVGTVLLDLNDFDPRQYTAEADKRARRYDALNGQSETDK